MTSNEVRPTSPRILYNSKQDGYRWDYKCDEVHSRKRCQSCQCSGFSSGDRDRHPIVLRHRYRGRTERCQTRASSQCTSVHRRKSCLNNGDCSDVVSSRRSPEDESLVFFGRWSPLVIFPVYVANLPPDDISPVAQHLQWMRKPRIDHLLSLGSDASRYDDQVWSLQRRYSGKLHLHGTDCEMSLSPYLAAFVTTC